MMSNPIFDLGGEPIAYLNWGDINPYFTQITLMLFIIAIIFTVFVFAKPEKQVKINMGSDGVYEKSVSGKNLEIRRFMAIITGIAATWGAITGDLYNYILAITLIGITNVGIVSASKQYHVLNAAFQYGLLIMLASIPLFGSAGLVLGTLGTLSLHELATLSVGWVPVILLIIGVMGEVGVGPIYTVKAELFRTPGAPYIIMIHVSSLLILIRTVEISIIMLGV